MAKKIYVGNLSFNTTEDQLASLFGQHGTVESSKIIMDRDTNRSKGFGFIEMSSDAETDQAIEALNGAEFEGRSLKVNEARPLEPRTGGGGGGGRPFRTGGGGGGSRGGFGGGGGGGRRDRY